jgi:hypothetical protein
MNLATALRIAAPLTVLLVTLRAQERTPPQTGALAVESDPENVVASRIAGEWRVDADLTLRLGGRDPGTTLVIRTTGQIPAGLPGKLVEQLQKTRIYAAGTLGMRDREHPFVLLERGGNMHVVWFRERGGNPVGDAESMIVALAPARDTANDLLLVGGDFNNQPFTAFQRRAPAQPPGGGAAAARTPTEAMADIERLLKAGKHVELMQTYMTPADKQRYSDPQSGRGTIESLAQEFAQKKAPRILALVTKLKDTTPSLNETGDEATFAHPEADRRMVLVRIDGRWCIKN